jgi:REP element-mobilizing transposase RayT
MPGFGVKENEYPHFITTTTVDWMPLFLSKPYMQILVDSLQFCQNKKELRIHAYVFMPDHLHLLVSCPNLAVVIGQFKSFTSHELVRKLQDDNRRLFTWIAKDAAAKAGESQHKIWQEGFHPEQVHSQQFYEQKINYIHGNPPRKGLVAEASDWLYSSAGFYYLERKGVLDVEPLMW